MVDSINQKHPRKIVNGEYREHSVCHTDTGSHIINKKPSEIGYLGLGISLYFKMLKFLIVLFLLLTFINIPMYYFYCSANSSNNYK
jgi:hypothetical protein